MENTDCFLFVFSPLESFLLLVRFVVGQLSHVSIPSRACSFSCPCGQISLRCFFLLHLLNLFFPHWRAFFCLFDLLLGNCHT